MAITYVGVQAMHELDGSITPLVMHWPDGRKFEVDKILDVRTSATVGNGLGKRYICQICNKQVNLFLDNDGKWYIKH